jgi:hypothetical protein
MSVQEQVTRTSYKNKLQEELYTFVHVQDVQPNYTLEMVRLSEVSGAIE